jgi:deoxyribodipyrimidine photo-lyase
MSPSEEIGLVWFRRDLRLADNPAWAAATSERTAVVPLFVMDRRLLARAGPFRRRQLIANLQSLDYDLFEHHGGRLLVRFGDPTVLVPDAAEVFQAGGVYWNDDVSPFAVGRDRRVRDRLAVPVSSWYGSLVHAPGRVGTERGRVPGSFPAFHHLWLDTRRDEWPEAGAAVVYDDPGEPLPTLDEPPPVFEGETEAARCLAAFVERVDDHAEHGHRRPDTGGSSQLSAHLRYGTISPRCVLDAVGATTDSRRAFARSVARRDWYAHLLAERPEMVGTPLDDRAVEIDWTNEPARISAWKGGFTGYPLVDAAMRQLRETGWMHDRVRAVAASFLVKDLLVDWRIGERHFRQLLVDADPAQNLGNWQDAAGVGLDGSAEMVPDPAALGRVHDPDGTYVRRWVPELAGLGPERVHAPWRASTAELMDARIELGRDYPEPVVDHATARHEYLARHTAARRGGRAAPAGESDHDPEPARPVVVGAGDDSYPADFS